MSTVTTKKPLPFPHAPQPVTEDSELMSTWASIDLWYSKVSTAGAGQARKRAYRKYGCHILLACKVLHESLQAKAKQQREDKSKDLGLTIAAMVRILDAHTWINANETVQEDFRWGSITVVDVAYEKACALYAEVFSKAGKSTLEMDQLPAPLEKLMRCERILHNLVLYTEPKPRESGQVRKTAHRYWKRIASLLEKQRKWAERLASKPLHSGS